MLRLEDVPGFLTAARAETGVPFTPERTDRVRVTPGFVPVVEGVVEVRRLALALGEGEILVAGSRPGVPGGGGFLAVAVDIVLFDGRLQVCSSASY
jgi:hypothetical protein